MKKESAKRTKYDIFISYRREGGLQYAVALQSMLLNMGYSVFLDVRDLSSGHFDTALLTRIEMCKDFILVLSDGALDRCAEPDDWVCREIEHAMKLNKNIIPLIPDGVSPAERLPHQLPQSISALPSYQIFSINLMQIKAAVSQLHDALLSSPHPYLRILEKALPFIAALLILAVLAIGYVLYRQYTSVFPHNKEQESIVSETIAYQTLNLGQANLAIGAHLLALDHSEAYLRAEASRSKAMLALDYAMEQTANSYANLMPLSDSLSERLDGTPFNKGDIASQAYALSVLLEGMYDIQSYLRTFLLDDPMLSVPHKLDYIKCCREITALDQDNLFYALNESLLPVSDQALSKFRTDLLPTLTYIYTGQPWIYLQDELISQQNRTQQKSWELTNELFASSGQEQHDTDVLGFELENNQEALEQARQELYQMHRPLDTDDPDTLWLKAITFISHGMNDAAAECFTLYQSKMTNEDDRRCANSALQFALQMDKTDVLGGCVVSFHEEGKPQQAVQVGDIIYALDNVYIYTYEDYLRVKESLDAPQLSILRFNGEAYSFETIPYDPKAGKIGLISLCLDI